MPGKAADAEVPALERVRLWDPALRIFHWALTVLVTATWLLAQYGPADMTAHFWIGYAILALLIFRILWGFFGPQTARFTHFVRGPRETLAYMRHVHKRSPSYWRGHNPMGAVSVVAMILALLAQITTGLISDPEDYINVGPLADKVPSSVATGAVGWHHLGATVILILVLLHVAVILWYRLWKREDLITPMLTGWKKVRRR